MQSWADYGVGVKTQSLESVWQDKNPHSVILELCDGGGGETNVPSL